MVKLVKFISLILISFLVSTLLVTTLPANVVLAATIYVDPIGPTPIQDAIDTASNGDTIIVNSGLYIENVDVNKTVTLQASGAVDVQASNINDHVFDVTANNVNISGFTVSGATGSNMAGIWLSGSTTGCNISGNFAIVNRYGIGCGGNGNTINNNTTKNNTYSGIYLYNADNNTVSGNDTGNTLTNNQEIGIFVANGSTGNSISGNTATYNTVNGMYIIESSHNNTVSNNQIHNNGNGGIALSASENCVLDGNTIRDNQIYYGILLHYSHNSQVKNNEVYNEDTGIALDRSDDCTILNNYIHDNGIGILIGDSPFDIYNNKIIGNSIVHNRPGSPGISGGIVLADNAQGTIVNFNIIIDNCSDPELYGLYNYNSTEMVNAENNWWGANNGPEPTGNGDKVSDYIDFNPWLVLDIEANPTSVQTFGNISAITGKLTMNSAGQNTSAQGYILDGTEIIFTTDKGSIGSVLVTKTTKNGQATATLTSGSRVETATICASAPHGHEVPTAQYRVCTNVDFHRPPKPITSSSYTDNNPQFRQPTDAKMTATTVYVRPQQTIAGQPVKIFGNIANRGELAGIYTATLKINGKVVDIREGALSGNMAKPLEFTVYQNISGTYKVDLNGQQAYFTIVDSANTKDSSKSNKSGVIFIVIILALVALSLTVLLIRRLNERY
jgi:parallel beta-helix repeat protein